MNDLIFTWEPVAHLLSYGLHDMGYRHWLEAIEDKTTFPYNPDWEAYQRMEAASEYRIIAVRWQGHLVGYAGIRIYENPQSKGVVCSCIQEYYIEPKFRKKAMSGIRLFRFIEDQLRVMKVHHVIVGQKEIVRANRGGLGKFFTFLGYRTQASLWAKTIGAGT